MVYVHKDPTIEAGVLHLVMSEMNRASNADDWHNALGRHGYALRITGADPVVTTLPHGVEVCRLPFQPSFGAL
ncbi:hypothetical protein [Roseovarius nanhaiticus]|uniref:hypothetical protein n=1 Tax=Roseovarius nanhaiticus TaxID=573024 RepID=UPI002492391E|nr:hypothetical protein [Roseovarius nanhaiticus]